MNDSSTEPPVNKQSGQGIVEYALIAVMILAVVIAILVLILPFFDPKNLENPCRAIVGDVSDSFECLDYKVNQCLASEKYTKDQCVELVGNGE